MKPLYFKIDAFEIPFRVQSENLKYFYDKFHFHPQCQITFIEKGFGTYIIGDAVGRFCSGQVFVLGANLPHVFKCDDVYFSDSTPGVSSTTVFFNQNFFNEELHHLDELSIFNAFIQEIKGGICFSNLGIEVEFERLKNAIGFNRILVFLEIIALLSSKEVGLKEFLNSKKEFDQLKNDKIERVYEFTLNKFKSKIKIEETANLINLTTNAFCKFFKQQTGQSYISFLNEIRINHACSLFLSSNLDVASVAFESGFNNLSNFNRQFIQKQKVSPKKYQMNLKKVIHSNNYSMKLDINFK